MKKQMPSALDNQGFSMVELLVAIVISSIVIAGIYATYHTHQKTYIVQKEVATMQQNLRAAMEFMETEIRMAGYDPTGSAGAGIQTTNATSINFTRDIYDGQDNNADGLIDDSSELGIGDGATDDRSEDITYQMLDLDNDGDLDLIRTDAFAAHNQVIADNIDALNFVYLDQNGNQTATLSQIRSVQITLVARAGRIDRGYTDAHNYTNQQGTEVLAQQNDSFRRKRLTAEAKCRNLGLI